MKTIQLQPLMGSLCIGLLFLFGAYQFREMVRDEHDQNHRHITEKRIKETAAALSQLMNVRLNLTSSLAAFVTINRDFTQSEFDRYASMLQKEMTGVRSLQLAPAGIVKYLTNLESNRKALGHDIFGDENRRPLAEKSVRDRSYLIAGPINLIQGGQAVIARRPLFFADDGEKTESFWGFSTVLIDIAPLLADANFAELEKDLTLSIRGKDGLGAKGDVFYGDVSTFMAPLAIADVILPNGRC